MNEKMEQLINEAIQNLDDAIDEINGNMSDSEEYQILSNMILTLRTMIDEV